MNENEFLILLQAKLDEEASKSNVNTDLTTIAKAIEKLKVQAEIDPNSVKNITQQLTKIINQTIVVDNIKIDAKQATSSAQQTGKKISQDIEQSIKSSLNLDNAIDKQVNNLMSEYGVKGKKAFNEIKTALIEYRQEVANTTITNKEFDDIFDLFANNSNGINKVTSAIANNMKIAKDAITVYKSLSEYISKINGKIYIPDSIKNEYGDDYSSMRSILGSAFTNDSKYKNSLDFENFVTELNSLLGNVIDMSHGAEAAFEDLVNKVCSARGGNYLSANELFGMGYLNESEMISKIDSCVNSINTAEQELAQSSTSATNIVIQNEEKKQQAIQENIKLQSELASFNERFKETGIATVNNDGVVDMKKSLEEVRNIYSDFGKVTIKNEMSDLVKGTEQFRVSIESSNGELKRTESFLMKLSGDGKSFVFADDMIKSSESTVRHLNEQQEAANKVILEEEKLANAMGDVREKSEQARQSEEKRQQLAQNNAINKALEEEYKQRQKLADQVNKIQLSIETGGYESKVESLIAKTRQWTDENGNARISTDSLSKAFNDLTVASNNYANSPTEANQKRLIATEKELDTQIKTVTNSVRKMNAELAKDSTISSLHNKVADFMSKNGKTVKYYGDDLRRIFNATAQGVSLTDAQVRQLNQDFNNVVITARNLNRLGKTPFQALREGMSSFSHWTSSTFLVMKSIQTIKGGISTVKGLDTALVDLKKTTTMTASELEDFYYASNKAAKQMGVTTEEIINQAAAWSRLGFNSAEQATKMAQLSSKFASISPGMSTDQAQEGLVSIIKAWGLDVSEVEREVMDNINTLGKFCPNIQ